MIKNGKTPLLRARKIEAILGVQHLYLKLEGANPTGHKCDRIAETIVKAAKLNNYPAILAQGGPEYLKSLAYFAENEGVDIYYPLFKNEKWKRTRLPQTPLLDFRKKHMTDPNEYLKDYAHSHHFFLADEGNSDQLIREMVYSDLAEEIYKRNIERIDKIFLKVTQGFTLKSLHDHFYKLHLSENIPFLPAFVYGVPLAHNNPTPIIFDDQASLSSSIVNEEISDELLIEAVALLKKENVNINKNDAHGFAAFLKQVHRREITDGNYVIILNSGKSNVKIMQLQNDDDIHKDFLVDVTRTWLAQYSDSVIETREAIENAMDKGFILLAEKDGAYEGICVVVCIGFPNFIPTYHLAYIGVKKQSKGRGIGIELIQKAIELSNGKLSLHVDLSNNKAKKLYEKMGFVHKYNRMIYQDI